MAIDLKTAQVGTKGRFTSTLPSSSHELAAVEEFQKELIMGMREEYQSFMERQLNDWKAYIDRLKLQTEQMNAQAKTTFDQQLELMRAKQNEAWEHFLTLKSAGEDSWKDSKPKLDKAWDDMKAAADRIAADYIYKK